MSTHLERDKIGSITYPLNEDTPKESETLNVKHETIGDLEENTGEIFYNLETGKSFL